MIIQLTPEVEQYIAEKIATGEYQSADEVINDAIRAKQLDEECSWDKELLIAKLKKGIASLEAGRTVQTTPENVLETLRGFGRR